MRVTEQKMEAIKHKWKQKQRQRQRQRQRQETGTENPTSPPPFLAIFSSPAFCLFLASGIWRRSRGCPVWGNRLLTIMVYGYNYSARFGALLTKTSVIVALQ